MEIALKLVSISDVVIDNFSPRVMPNWGLDYDSMKKVRPDLIAVRLSGMGQTGPWKDFVAFGPTIQALSGLTHLTSFDRSSPLGLGYAHADAVVGLYGALAVLGALAHRDQSGQGQYIDLSEYEAMCSLLGPALLEAQAGRRKVEPRGNRPDSIPAAPYGCFRCRRRDRWCVIAVYNDVQWRALCRALDRPDWLNDDRFTDLEGREAHQEILDQMIEALTSRENAPELATRLEAAGVPPAWFKTPGTSPMILTWRPGVFFQALDHPVLGPAFAESSPIRFETAPEIQWKPSPLLGEDNRYVYLDLLGFTEVRFNEYVEAGVIG